MDRFEYSANGEQGFSAHVKEEELIIIQDWYEEEYPHDRILQEWRFDISTINTVVELDQFCINKFEELYG